MFSRSFTVEEVPIAKGRSRFRRVSNFVSTYTPKKTKDFERIISESSILMMAGHDPLETPLRLIVTFYMPIPLSHSKKRTKECIDGIEKHTKKPDADNLLKSLLDGMNEIVYKDDAQIVCLTGMKKYSSNPRIEIFVSEDLL